MSDGWETVPCMCAGDGNGNTVPGISVRWNSDSLIVMGGKTPLAGQLSDRLCYLCASELMVHVVLFLLREPASQWSQREAQRLSCSRLPCCGGRLHCCHLSAASLGFATWSQDPLPELGTQNLKVPLSLEPRSRPHLWTLLLPLKPALNLSSCMDFPYPLSIPLCLPIPSCRLFSYRVTDEDQPRHPKKTERFGFYELFLTSTLSYCRFHNVYCTYIASSCVSIISLPASHLPFPSRWVQSLFPRYSVPRKVSMYQASHIPISSRPAGEASSPSLVFLSSLQPHLQNLPQSRILCHLSCVLTLSLQWVCSLCSSIFKEVFRLPQR